MPPNNTIQEINLSKKKVHVSGSTSAQIKSSFFGEGSEVGGVSGGGAVRVRHQNQEI